MADGAKGAASGLGSALILMLLLTGVAIWQWPLESLRPAARMARVDRIAGLQDIPARLWQDPFVATRDSAKAPDSGRGAAKALDKAAAPVRRPNGVGEVIDEYLKARSAQPGFKVEILAVMVGGGRSADDAENRLRTRYAVVSGILASEYAPDDPENLGLAVVSIPQSASPSQTTFSLPFEWYTCRPRGDPETIYRGRHPNTETHAPKAQPGCGSDGRRLLVLWINNTVLDQTGRPLLNLLKLFPGAAGGKAARITAIGPTNSDTLSKYVEEAKQHAGELKIETERLEGLRILSPSATVTDAVLLREPERAKADKADLAQFFWEKIKLRFVRTVGSDDNLVASLVGELRLRGLSPPLCFYIDWRCDSPNTVLLIYEADSLYARSLVDKFAQKMLGPCDELKGVNFDKCVNLQRDRLLLFDYLRGLDGEAGARDADGAANKDEGAPDRRDTGRPGTSTKERPQGPSQYDYLRRMSRSILEIQASMLSQIEKRSEPGAKRRSERLGSWMKPRIRAVGVIGSDTFDKLLILQAVKPLLPEATFFTVDLDARFLEPDQYSWTRNLVVASNFGLELDPNIQKESAPFRDTYQSGAYLAVRLGLACPDLKLPAELLNRPRLYEIGRGEAVDLSAFAGGKDPLTGCALVDADGTPSLHRERADRETLSFGPGAFARAMVVCMLGFLLFSTFFTTTRYTALWSDFAKFAAAIGAVVVGYDLFYYVIISNDAEEPWRFLTGVSAWPTQIVLVLTIGYCLWSMLRIRRSVEESNARLGSEFFGARADADLEKTHPGRSRHEALAALGGKLVRPRWKTGADRGYASLWQEYLKHGNLSWSMLRAAGASLLFLIAWIALTITEPPVVPVRGQLSYFVDYFVSKAALLALMWLAFFVADQVRLCIGFFGYFMKGDTDWPAETLRRFGQSAAAKGEERHLLSDYVDIRLFAERSKVVGETVYYPFVALVLFVAARLEFFDAWTWPLALGLMVGACFVLLVLAFVLLRFAADRARSGAAHRLGMKYLELIGEGDAKRELAAQVGHTLELVRNCSEGAFRPLSEEPVVRALMIPTGGLGGLGALQYFFVQRF